MRPKKILFAAILLAITSIAEGKIICTPPWMPQTQFAGVYVAMDKGYFADEGLDVEIKHIKQSTRQSAVDLLKSGESNIIILQFVGALIARDQGVPLVNVLQTSQNCGLVYVSKKPVTSYKQLQNKKISTWENGFREIPELAFFEKGVKVNWIPSLSVVNLYVANAVDGMLAYSFNEYIRLLMAIGEISNKNVLHFSDIGYNYPEEGIYTTEDYYRKNKKDVKKFAEAVKRGWNYARENPAEALAITKKYMKLNNIPTSNMHQELMLREILRLQLNSRGVADYAPIPKQMFDEITRKMYKVKMLKRIVKYEDMIMK